MRSFYDLMGIPPKGFDPDHRFVTSWILTPAWLASLRLLLSLYCFATIFITWGWDGAHGNAGAIGREFSYFTDITFWGITCYMLVSSIHGFMYVRHGQSWLDRWPRPLQLLHSLYYTTVVTLPILVTLVFWLVLYPAKWFPDVFDAWTQVSHHALNSVFALIEITVPATNSPPWLHLPVLWLILLLYLALAYLTHYLQGWYPYSFLDPSNGHAVKVLAYAFGILAAITVIFIVVLVLIFIRNKVTRPGRKSKRDAGPLYFYTSTRQDGIEMGYK